MNKQNKPNSRGIEWTDYTWNPIAGCKHACRWHMPDGKIAICYAEAVANGVARDAYPHGFEHLYWHPKRLEEPLALKTPSRIFLDSMSDLMGAWVPMSQIGAVFEICRQAKQHSFQLLTKNAPRLLKVQPIPRNIWVGVSSPPDFMLGHRLTIQQQHAMLQRALWVLGAIEQPVRWMSFEPLSWDVADIVAAYPGVLNWAVIGAASNGPAEFPPDESDLRRLLDVLDRQGVPVFFKGNLRSLPWARDNWRENMPAAHNAPPPVQQSLF